MPLARTAKSFLGKRPSFRSKRKAKGAALLAAPFLS